MKTQKNLLNITGIFAILPNLEKEALLEQATSTTSANLPLTPLIMAYFQDKATARFFINKSFFNFDIDSDYYIANLINEFEFIKVTDEEEIKEALVYKLNDKNKLVNQGYNIYKYYMKHCNDEGIR